MDSSGNVYTTGYFFFDVDFDPGAGSTELTSAGSNDVFVSKLDPLGNFVWAKRFGGPSSQVSFSIAVDDSGNVYTTGYFQGTADFDPGSGTSNLTSVGSEDVFVSKLNSVGNFVWAKSFGGIGYSVAVDSSGNVYTTGYFAGTEDFDPGAGTSNILSLGPGSGGNGRLSSSTTPAGAGGAGGLYGGGGGGGGEGATTGTGSGGAGGAGANGICVIRVWYG